MKQKKRIKKIFSMLLVFMSFANPLVFAQDPNCNVNVGANGPINNIFPGNINQNARDQAQRAIANLDFADLYRDPPFRINRPPVRLDAQGTNHAGDANWQIQVNGVNGHSTIAHVQVSANLANASTLARQTYVQRRVRHALNESLNTGNRYDVTGICN